MAVVEPNYFTCTLGEAAKWKQQQRLHQSMKPFRTVIGLIDRQAESIPHSPALGFANPESGTPPVPMSLTFRQLHDQSMLAAQTLSSYVRHNQSMNVGLLCTSSVDFVLTWLGLVRLGYSVLLLAPQLEPPAILHLCSTLEIGVVLVEGAHYQRVTRVDDSLKAIPLPTYQTSLPTTATNPRAPPSISEIAYYVHTSGTSAGLPKPIPQSHSGVVDALPCFSSAKQPATFSTTPLYHGGLPDCFRAWTSGAMIWFFPEGVMPVTGANITRAIDFARSHSTAPVRYFSSVPYVLQMLADEENGIHLLRTMDLVGVGGAALPSAVGNMLVESGVKLLSRLGSAECGFLMSSHRDYPEDQDWEYLRPVENPELLSFEPRADGLSELVVKSGWPLRVKRNRDDGSFATSDLFKPHPSRPNTWRYHSRADAQITLANGKKFDPSPIEGDIMASTNLLRDALIFGSGRDYPGVLMFPASSSISSQAIVDSIWPTINDMNAAAQSHARIPKSMLVVVPPRDKQPPLEKSSKGTILRRQAEERYAGIVDTAYQTQRISSPTAQPTTDDEMLSAVSNCFTKVLGRELDPDKSIYHEGVDSIACIQIRRMIEATCLAPTQQDLPMNIIYDQGSITSLVTYLQRVRRGGCFQEKGSRDTPMSVMKRVAEKYSYFKCPNLPLPKSHERAIVLTGATGFLGSHILNSLRRSSSIEKVYCLVRAMTPQTAHERVSEGLLERGLPGLDDCLEAGHEETKVICLPFDLSHQDLGLGDKYRLRVQQDATVFIHSAWRVNFNLKLDSFEDQIDGTRNLINLATGCGARFIFISSTAAVSCSDSRPIPEAISEDPSEASPLGYSQSKWVAEQVCVAANKTISGVNTANMPPISAIRIGQLCGNNFGVWNTSEAYPLLLSTASLVGCLPDLAGEILNWIPVELAAQAVLDIAFSEDGIENRGTPVYHILNPYRSPTWNQMLQWISEGNQGPPFEIVSPMGWMRRLEEVFTNSDADHPSQALLWMWKAAFCHEENVERTTESDSMFSVSLAAEASATMKRLKPLDRGRVVVMWEWIRKNVGHTVHGS